MEFEAEHEIINLRITDAVLRGQIQLSTVLFGVIHHGTGTKGFPRLIQQQGHRIDGISFPGTFRTGHIYITLPRCIESLQGEGIGTESVNDVADLQNCLCDCVIILFQWLNILQDQKVTRNRCYTEDTGFLVIIESESTQCFLNKKRINSFGIQ